MRSTLVNQPTVCVGMWYSGLFLIMWYLSCVAVDGLLSSCVLYLSCLCGICRLGVNGVDSTQLLLHTVAHQLLLLVIVYVQFSF